MKGINATRGAQYIAAALRHLPPRQPTRWLAFHPRRLQLHKPITASFSTTRSLKADESKGRNDPPSSSQDTGAQDPGNTETADDSPRTILPDTIAQAADDGETTTSETNSGVDLNTEDTTENTEDELDTKTSEASQLGTTEPVGEEVVEVAENGRSHDSEEIITDLIGGEHLAREPNRPTLEGNESEEPPPDGSGQTIAEELSMEAFAESLAGLQQKLHEEPESIALIAEEQPMFLKLLLEHDADLRDRIAETHPDIVQQIIDLDRAEFSEKLMGTIAEQIEEEEMDRVRNSMDLDQLKEESEAWEREEKEIASYDDSDDDADEANLRVVPASPSYFSGQPDFTDALLELRALLRKYGTLPTVEAAHAPRVAWKKYTAYKIEINEPVRAAHYHKIVEIVQRLNRIHPALMPDEVQAALQKFKRNINPHDNKPNLVVIDEHGRAVGVGRRKTSSAKAWVVEGNGEVLINGKTLTQMFSRLHDRESAVWALKATQRIDKYNVFALVTGGGVTGQAEAITLAIAKGLMVHEPALKPALRRAGCVTRDPRKVERKKTGHLKARKKPAWVKR